MRPRGRKALYGPVALPDGLDSILLFEEGDVIEGEVRDVLAPERELAEPRPAPAPEPMVETDPPFHEPPGEAPPQAPDEPPADGLTYEAVLERAGLEGLDQDAFELYVLGCTLATFQKRQGANPAVADRKLTQYLEQTQAAVG